MTRPKSKGTGAARSGARKRTAKPSARIDSIFRVFADATRLRILRLLQNGALCVGDLVEILGAPQPTVSRHLAYLRRAGFVETRQYGLWMFYELAAAQNTLHGKLLDCIATCDGLLPNAKADATRARALRRSGGCCPEGRRLMEQSRRGAKQ